MAKIIPCWTLWPFISNIGISIVIFLHKIILLMQGIGMPHEESFVEEVNEAICLSCEVKIVQKVVLSWIPTIYSTHHMTPCSSSRERNQNIFICISRWEFDSEEMFLNKQETHNIKEKGVESTFKDTQEKV